MCVCSCSCCAFPLAAAEWAKPSRSAAALRRLACETPKNPSVDSSPTPLLHRHLIFSIAHFHFRCRFIIMSVRHMHRTRPQHKKPAPPPTRRKPLSGATPLHVPEPQTLWRYAHRYGRALCDFTLTATHHTLRLCMFRLRTSLPHRET